MININTLVVVTVFLPILNQIEFYLIQNWSPQPYPTQFKRKLKYSFLSAHHSGVGIVSGAKCAPASHLRRLRQLFVSLLRKPRQLDFEPRLKTFRMTVPGTGLISSQRRRISFGRSCLFSAILSQYWIQFTSRY